MAHMFGSGVAVALDRRSGFERFYRADEAVFYDDLPDLAASLRALIEDDAEARVIARGGWERTWTVFESGRVLAYMLAQLFDEGGATDVEWSCDRWFPQ